MTCPITTYCQKHNKIREKSAISIVRLYLKMILSCEILKNHPGWFSFDCFAMERWWYRQGSRFEEDIPPPGSMGGTQNRPQIMRTSRWAENEIYCSNDTKRQEEPPNSNACIVVGPRRQTRGCAVEDGGVGTTIIETLSVGGDEKEPMGDREGRCASNDDLSTSWRYSTKEQRRCNEAISVAVGGMPPWA